MNHVLKMVPPDRAEQLASYGNPDLPIAEGLVQALTQFLRGITVVARSDPDANATQLADVINDGASTWQKDLNS